MRVTLTESDEGKGRKACLHLINMACAVPTEQMLIELDGVQVSAQFAGDWKITVEHIQRPRA